MASGVWIVSTQISGDYFDAVVVGFKIDFARTPTEGAIGNFLAGKLATGGFADRNRGKQPPVQTVLVRLFTHFQAVTDKGHTPLLEVCVNSASAGCFG